MHDPKNRDEWDGATRPGDAAEVLQHAYGELAGEEALFRAFLAERDLEPERAGFWVNVYGRLKPARQNQAP